MNKPKILSIGNAYVDINCTGFTFGDEGVLPDTEVCGDAYETVLGGSAVNFAKMCVALGVDSVFVGKRGKDKFGVLMERLFKASGIEPELIADNNAQTNISFNMVNAGGESIMAIVGSANQTLSSRDVESAVGSILGRCNYLYIGGCFKQPQLLDAYLDLANRAKTGNVVTVLDHSRLPHNVTDEQKQKVRQLVGMVDYYLPSRDEFLQLWGTETIEKGMLKIQSNGLVTIVKDGANGAWVVQDGKPVLIPAFKVMPLHTIGAGDSFNAGFIAAQSRGLNIRDSVIFASATAALKISKQDLPTVNEVDEFIASNR